VDLGAFSIFYLLRRTSRIWDIVAHSVDWRGGRGSWEEVRFFWEKKFFLRVEECLALHSKWFYTVLNEPKELRLLLSIV